MASTKPRPGAPHSRHRRAGGMLVLPAEGCDLPPPRLPSRKWTAPERALWRDLWASPQAVMWDDSYVTAVAMYVVHSRAALEGRASAWMAQEARHLGDRLGLTPEGLHALGWRLAEPGENPTAAVTPLRGVR